MVRESLVHDYLYVYGGAERMLEHVHLTWPDAPVHTLLYVREQLPESIRRMDVRTTWVNRLPARLRLQRVYAMLQPAAFATVRPDGDVLSLASFGAKAVRASGGRRHVCYCFTPPRFLWGPFSGIRRDRLAVPVRTALRGVEALLRRWDHAAAQRVDAFITMSRYVAARVQRVYGRASEIVPPPVDVDRFLSLDTRPGEYFLAVGRFEAYKRFDLAIAACHRLRVPLHIVGGGVDEPALLQRAAGSPYVRFLGRLSDTEVEEQLAGCRALLFPGEEDFGLTAVEAQAAGKPVIAYAEGAAGETVLTGQTGMFFDDLSVDALAAAIERFDPAAFDPDACRENARRFAPEPFRARLKETVERLWGR
ncbi:MAG TPA: glycosyltransferase [Chloroflexota bacterium]|nr:glycosyltransferase [Chloroflexota bacterium]